MKVTLDRTESRTTFLIAEPEPSDLESYIEKTYQHMSKRIDVPGYTKGDAPRDVFEKHVGKDKITGDAIKELGHAIYPKIINDHNIKNWLQPMVTVLQINPPKFEIAVPLKPIVELADYHSMDIKPESLKISDEDIDDVLSKSRLQLAEHHPVERPVKEGDLISIDIKGTESGKSFLDKKGLRIHVTQSFASDMPGLYKKLVGIKKDEESKFKLRLPEDHANILLAGKEVDFTVKVYDVREVELPELNDKFANKVAAGVKTMDKLRERIRFNMESEREQNSDTKFKERVVNVLIENSHIEFPSIMIELQANLLVDEYDQQIKSSCQDKNEYEDLKKTIPEESIKENARSLAKKRILWSLVLDEVAKAEGIEITDEEIASEIDGMTQNIEEIKQKEARRYLHSYDRQNVKDLIRARKTINRLSEIVSGQ